MPLNIRFQDWAARHPPGHDAYWLRQAYPWPIFQRTDFELLGPSQEIKFAGLTYNVTVLTTRPGRKGRVEIDFTIEPGDEPGGYDSYIIYDRAFTLVLNGPTLITIFTQGVDPGENLLRQFFQGNFDRLSANRSRSLHRLLGRTLLARLARREDPTLKPYQPYRVGTEGVKLRPTHADIPRPAGSFAPILSRGRDFWFLFSEYEEEANYAAIRYSNQCMRMVSVFLTPTLSRHHKCNYHGVEVLSFFQYANRQDEWAPQVRFLLHDLFPPDRRSIRDLKTMLHDAVASGRAAPIDEGDLEEAYAVMGLPIKDEADAFYVLTAFNLINRYVAQVKDDSAYRRWTYRRWKRSPSELYGFKVHLASALARLVTSNVETVQLFISDEVPSLRAYVRVRGFQFTFTSIKTKDVPLGRDADGIMQTTDDLEKYRQSARSAYQPWSGVRLQPVAPLLFALARREREIARAPT